MCPRVGNHVLGLVSYEKCLVYEKYQFAEHSREEKLHLFSDFLFPGNKSLPLPKTQTLIFACDSGTQTWSPLPKMTLLFCFVSFCFVLFSVKLSVAQDLETQPQMA